MIKLCLLICAIFWGCHHPHKVEILNEDTIKAPILDTPNHVNYVSNTESNDKEIKLEKLIFHSSECFGKCPTLHFQLDSSKLFKLFAEHVYLSGSVDELIEDTSRTGYFTGSIKNKTYNKLIDQLESLGLDTLKLNEVLCCDGSIYTLIVYYNGKRIRLESMHPTDEFMELVYTLDDICLEGKLHRTNERFVMETN